MTHRRRATWLGTLALIAACGGDSATVAVPVASARFVVAPSDVVAGTAFNVNVELLGSDGARAKGAADQVSISVSDGSNITGPSAVRASNGLATFTGISLTHAATGLVLRASVGTQTATSAAFSVAPGPPSASASAASTAAIIVPTESTTVAFKFADNYGNAVSNATVAVTAGSGATFTPSTGTTDSAGKFSPKLRTSVGGDITVSATVNGAPVALAPLPACAFPSLALPGSASGTLSASSCVIAGRPTALFKFTTSAAGGAAFTLTSAFVPRLEVKTDPPLANVFAAPGQSLPAEWLLPPGTFQLRLGSSSGVGGYALSAVSGPGNAGCVNRYLATVGVFAGQALAAGDCNYGDGTFVDKYVVYSPNPCSFRLHSTTFTNFIFLMELGTGHFLDGRGGDAIGVDALLGMPQCSYIGSPVEIWVLPDEGELGGAYTLTYALFPLPSLRAGQRAAPLGTRERVAVDPRVLRRLRAMAKATAR